ncbi:MAG: RNA polymerase sporulation sigma factor SigK [Clostridia bacterium]|nr:RNA polymerase sporulation sigma factor SigK [Clostridia bacterium]
MIFEFLLSNMLIFALHLDNNGIFPPPLNSKDEKKYLELLSHGDINAKEKLIKHNLRLVAHIIKKYYSQDAENEELISVGTVGLIKAINTFDHTKGVRLATYASRCIENEILMYFRNQKKSSLDISLDEPIETDAEGNPLTLIDIISMDDTIVDDITLKNNIKLLIKFINEIQNERERKLIIIRYGLDGNEPKTQSQIASMYGISRSYVSRLETKILKKLRKRFESEAGCN